MFVIYYCWNHVMICLKRFQTLWHIVMSCETQLWKQSISAKMNCALMFIMRNHYGRICLSELLKLKPSNDTFKVISDILAICFDMWKQQLMKSISAMQRKWICSLMFIICNHYGIKCVSDLLQFLNNVMMCLKWFLTSWYIALILLMNCALMFIISNHYGTKCASNLVLLEPCNDV